MTENELSKIVFEAGLKIHKKFGPGLFESVYEECMFYELNKIGLKVEKQKVLPIISDVRFPTQLFPYRCSSKDKVYRNYKFLCRFCFYSAHILFVLAR